MPEDNNSAAGGIAVAAAFHRIEREAVMAGASLGTEGLTME